MKESTSGSPGPSQSRLGYLEIEVLEWLWTIEWGDVRAAHEAIGRPRALSRNTLHSTLERLVRKRLARRVRRGRVYHYRAIVARDSWVRDALVRAFETTPGADPALLLASFVDLAERVDEAGLKKLEGLVRDRRLERERENEERNEGKEE